MKMMVINIFYQIIGGYFDEGEGNFNIKVHPKKNNETLMGKRSIMVDKMHEIMRRMKNIKCNT
jgi:hypothetical protein